MLTEGSVHDQCDRLSDGLIVRDSDGRHPDREHESTLGAARDPAAARRLSTCAVVVRLLA